MRLSGTYNPDTWDIRTRRGFLWFPKGDEEGRRWLEYAVWEEQYTPWISMLTGTAAISHSWDFFQWRDDLDLRKRYG